jgi:hypothetical protein
MSGQSIVMFVSVIAISIAANRANDASQSMGQKSGFNSRGPASIVGKKDIGHLSEDLVKHTHKVRGPIVASVELVGQAPAQPGDIFVLKGVVSSETALENVEFSWRMPEGVEVVNGQTSSIVSALGAEKPFETQITLRQVSPDNERVTLHVRGRDADLRFGEMAIYHTLDQQQIQAARMELRSKTEEYMKSSAGSSGTAPAKGNLEVQSHSHSHPHSHSQGKKLKVFH